jgi:hypothetical protein
VVPQAFLLAFGIVYWTEHAANRWLNWVMVAAFVVAVGLPILGLLVGVDN